MSQFAKTTSVSAERSRSEIEQVLLRYVASKFAYMTNSDGAMIAFEANNRRIRFEVPLPNREDWRNYKKRSDSISVSTRTDAQIEPLYQQPIPMTRHRKNYF